MPITNTELYSQCQSGIDAIGRSTWDGLVERAYTSTVFHTYGWISAWCNTIGAGRELIVPCVYFDSRLVGAAVFIQTGRVVSFGAAERADYGDLLIDGGLDESLQRKVALELLRCAKQATGGLATFVFDKVPSRSRSLVILAELQPDFYLVPLQKTPAPRLDMSAVEDRLNKKSLKRHENGLKKLGEVVFHTYTRTDEVLPRLPDFFQQHLDRWRDTESPSLFNELINREFYTELTKQLEESGSLRYSELTLDGKLVAAHFGFFYADSFIWYKPSYDVSFAKKSPGEVLIRNLLRLAREEGAAVFDFTIGGEAFKYRFATEDPTVTKLFLSDSRTRASVRRLRFQLRESLDGLLLR